MKIAILVAGKSEYFPLFIDKPKCLYHLNGEIQLERVIKSAKMIVDEKDIIIVAGYKYKYIKRYLIKYPQIELRINKNYLKSSIYSFRKAIENVNDDIIFTFGDESIGQKNFERIAASKRKMALLCHDTFYYYSLGIFKLCKEKLYLLNDDKYLSMDYMKKIYCFANDKKDYDGNFTINSGICIGYIIIDLVRRIGHMQKVENPIDTYNGNEIDFIHFNAKKEYKPDLDYIWDTDEYKQNILLRLYTDFVSKPIKKIYYILKNCIELKVISNRGRSKYNCFIL